MRYRRRFIIPKRITGAVLPVLLLALLIGCSSSGEEPVSPDPYQSGGDNAGVSSGGDRFVWGFWQGFADTESGEFRMTTMRIADMHFNLVNVLNATSGIDYEILWGQSDPASGLFRVRVTITHPFPFVPKYAGFDVRGIFITGASQPVGQNLWTAGENHPRLLNADGWTRWWNPLEFPVPGYFGYTNGNLGYPDTGQYDAQLNGFKIFADALNETQDAIFLASLGLNEPGGRGVFSSSQKSRVYKLRFPPGSSRFNYAVDASWANPSTDPPEIPDDFPPGANANEPWYISIDVLENTLEYFESTGEHSGNLKINIKVYDWQGKMNGAVASQLSQVNLLSQDLMGITTVPATLTYDDGNLAMYTADLSPAVNPTSAGTKWLGVEAVSNFGKYKQSWEGAPGDPLAAYYVFSIDVAGGTPPPQMTKVFGVHAYVLRHSDGTNPSISDAEIAQDIAWANGFWNQYGFGVELAQKSFINSSTYYNLDPQQSVNMWSQHHDNTGLINLYYVNSIVGMGGAFAIMACEFEENWGQNTFIVFDASDNAGVEEVLAHELGHVVGMLEDAYLLDWYSCFEIASGYCGYYPTDQYCYNNTAVGGNMMYYIGLWPNPDPSDYYFTSTDLEMSTSPIDSQAENAAYFHTHYPAHFKDMQ